MGHVSHNPNHQAHAPASDAEVTAANRRFYDEIASQYESVDSRRNSGDAHDWLSRVLDSLAARVGGKNSAFLDAGAGTGFLVARAAGKFGRRIAVDVSEKMLAKIADAEVERICSTLGEIPLPPATIDCVGSFATLHHLYEPADFFREAHRILRPGGALYTDHDISSEFVSRFALPLKLYRKLCDHGRRYLAACPGASAHDYDVSEFHGGRGLSGAKLRADLLEAGFRSVEITHHWEGMGPFALVGRILPSAFGARAGWAPIVRIIAIK